MTRTMFRVVCLLFGAYVTLTAGARNKDYEVCMGNCEQRLEVASPDSLNATTICYETARYVEPILAEIPRKLDFGDADPREEMIRRFFIRNHSPGAKYARLFVQVAETNNLDWRLLPVLALIESGGGRVHVNNNIFGWDSGKARFKSIEDGIRHVGRSLSLGPYKGKPTRQKIRVFNTHSTYHRLADKLLKSLDTCLTEF